MKYLREIVIEVVKRVLVSYLRWKLRKGHHQYVFGLSDTWIYCDGFWALAKYCAIADVQKDLSNYGYYLCPYCLWAMKKEYAHFSNPKESSYCYEQFRKDLRRQWKEFQKLQQK